MLIAYYYYYFFTLSKKIVNVIRILLEFFFLVYLKDNKFTLVKYSSQIWNLKRVNAIEMIYVFISLFMFSI